MGLFFDGFFGGRKNRTQEAEAYFTAHGGTIHGVCARYLPKSSVAHGEMVVEIFVELFTLHAQKLPTEKDELIAFAISSLVKKCKPTLTALYERREDSSYAMTTVLPHMFHARMEALPAGVVVEALHRLPHLEQVVYSLAAIDGYTSKEIAQMLGAQEIKVEKIITSARKHIFHNLLQVDADYGEEIFVVAEEKIR